VTKIYIYCLYDKDDILIGVYSSLKAVHRDAIKICNQGASPVLIKYGTDTTQPTSLGLLRRLFKGEINTKVVYVSDTNRAVILKTKLRE
jgi:hypothetical protein